MNFQKEVLKILRYLAGKINTEKNCKREKTEGQ